MLKIGDLTPTATADGHWTDGNVAGGVAPTRMMAGWFNAVQDELVNVLTAAGVATDPKNNAQLLAALNKLYVAPSQVPASLSGIVGSTRNLAMNVTAASATATITADEIIVETALGGNQFRIASFNKQINLGITGAGGMDNGTVPANGFVGIYAIYNPTTGASALLAVNAAAVIGEVYGGNNMPSGYSASALLTVVPTAGSQFKPFLVKDRDVGIPIGTLLTTSSSLSDSQISFNGLAPINSSSLNGIISLNGDTSGSLSVTLASTPNRIGPRQFGGYSVANTGLSASFQDIKIINKGSLYFSAANATSGNAAFIIYCTGYSI
ncbi:hypothetical protein [Pantoea ananatis]|uniref:hypothetical protein n=1 Tax=Pantoea ananas TaxID=553 RepID=UPI001B30A3F2|nr:hypothetical protein [Pantoea ananatis]